MAEESRTTQRRIAAVLHRMPHMMRLLHIFFRHTQAHITADVVGVVLNRNRQILLVEHVFHPNWSWGLPGGWLNRAEDPASGLKRELREETELTVSVVRPLLVNTGYYFASHLDISFLCTAESDTVSLCGELLSHCWLRPHEMPRLPPFHHASIEAAVLQPEYQGIES